MREGTDVIRVSSMADRPPEITSFLGITGSGKSRYAIQAALTRARTTTDGRILIICPDIQSMCALVARESTDRICKRFVNRVFVQAKNVKAWVVGPPAKWKVELFPPHTVMVVSLATISAIEEMDPLTWLLGTACDVVVIDDAGELLCWGRKETRRLQRIVRLLKGRARPVDMFMTGIKSDHEDHMGALFGRSVVTRRVDKIGVGAQGDLHISPPKVAWVIKKRDKAWNEQVKKRLLALALRRMGSTLLLCSNEQTVKEVTEFVDAYNAVEEGDSRVYSYTSATSHPDRIVATARHATRSAVALAVIKLGQKAVTFPNAKTVVTNMPPNRESAVQVAGRVARMQNTPSAVIMISDQPEQTRDLLVGLGFRIQPVDSLLPWFAFTGSTPHARQYRKLAPGYYPSKEEPLRHWFRRFIWYRDNVLYALAHDLVPYIRTDSSWVGVKLPPTPSRLIPVERGYAQVVETTGTAIDAFPPPRTSLVYVTESTSTYTDGGVVLGDVSPVAVEARVVNQMTNDIHAYNTLIRTVQRELPPTETGTRWEKNLHAAVGTVSFRCALRKNHLFLQGERRRSQGQWRNWSHDDKRRALVSRTYALLWAVKEKMEQIPKTGCSTTVLWCPAGEPLGPGNWFARLGEWQPKHAWDPVQQALRTYAELNGGGDGGTIAEWWSKVPREHQTWLQHAIPGNVLRTWSSEAVRLALDPVLVQRACPETQALARWLWDLTRTPE